MIGTSSVTIIYSKSFWVLLTFMLKVMKYASQKLSLDTSNVNKYLEISMFPFNKR